MRARGSSGPSWVKYQLRSTSCTLWYMFTSPFRISPERGSTTWAAVALATAAGLQYTTERRASARSKSGSSVGAHSARMASRKPASANAPFHASTPFFTQGLSQSGVAGSIQKVIGVTGATSSPRRNAAVSDGSRR